MTDSMDEGRWGREAQEFDSAVEYEVVDSDDDDDDDESPETF
ncbi:hypothetical protein GCM10011374_41130 [Kocuria dechangensis]|uniref:Uncharacterized protein n=1 Tax=Kocuria dechangensis TaxID=1176249 RepID=A0A917HAA3_9MICC|nr:hypothetical protein [Kocuria dechangensis]GGG72137.1 hypothetical protein GCM10011374_41130 [Kocuria dechangensis]